MLYSFVSADRRATARTTTSLSHAAIRQKKTQIENTDRKHTERKHRERKHTEIKDRDKEHTENTERRHQENTQTKNTQIENIKRENTYFRRKHHIAQNKASKTSVSCEASSKFHRTSFLNERFVCEASSKFHRTSFQNERFVLGCNFTEQASKTSVSC